MKSNRFRSVIRGFILIALGISILSGTDLFIKSVFSPLTGIDPDTSFSLACQSLSLIATLTIAIDILKARKIRGQILVDCGVNPAIRPMLFYGLLMLIFPIIDLYLIIFAQDGEFKSRDFFRVIGPLQFSLFCLAMALGRLQFAENGISHAFGYLPWNRIISWQWHAEKQVNLMITYKTRWNLLFGNEWKIQMGHISDETQQAILQILHEKLAQAELPEGE